MGWGWKEDLILEDYWLASQGESRGAPGSERECYPKHKEEDQDEGSSGKGMARLYRPEFDSGTQTVDVYLHTRALAHAPECLCAGTHTLDKYNVIESIRWRAGQEGT